MTATPRQLELIAGMTREQLLLASAPHIDPESPKLKEDMEKIERIALAEAARAALDGPSVDDFDWANDPAVILHEQRATAVYRNKYDGLVIRQEKAWDEESDSLLVITAENCGTFIDRVADILGVPSIGGPKR